MKKHPTHYEIILKRPTKYSKNETLSPEEAIEKISTLKTNKIKNTVPIISEITLYINEPGFLLFLLMTGKAVMPILNK